jgi:hypothetical protein
MAATKVAVGVAVVAGATVGLTGAIHHEHPRPARAVPVHRALSPGTTTV